MLTNMSASKIAKWYRENKRKRQRDYKNRENIFMKKIEFETVKINSAYKDLSTTWFVRRKLTDAEENKIIQAGKKASKNKKYLTLS